MKDSIFSKKDKDLIHSLGMSEDQLVAQIDLFKKGAPYLKLERPCTPGDGIKTLSESDIHKLNENYLSIIHDHALLKFVPASGAASRMFKTIQKFVVGDAEIYRDTIAERAKQGDADCKELIEFVDNIHQFAFFGDLRKTLSQNGYDIDELIETGRLRKLFDFLLTSKGLSYSNTPKGLIPFHRYQDEKRTAFEEHFVEAMGYIRNKDQTCSIHFTASPEHIGTFSKKLNILKSKYEKTHKLRFQAEFSVQDRSTDTIAVDMKNNPFRLKDGSLFFRPAGHGALIENLNNIKGDIIFIKNIDNIVPDHLKEQTLLWKRVLAVYLVNVQKQVFSYLEQMSKWPIPEKVLDEALEFCKRELNIHPPENKPLDTVRKKKKFLIRKLNRPLRVCGMVKNRGEVGGGPFWVSMYDGTHSLQIVETSQINPDAEDQQRILASSTHFNPVDIVCGVRNWEDHPFDLRHYIHSEAVFISVKSKGGHDLKTLERPGLWNGGMSDWNTIFIEVPGITFNPVKSVNDLLRNEHQVL